MSSGKKGTEGQLIAVFHNLLFARHFSTTYDAKVQTLQRPCLFFGDHPSGGGWRTLMDISMNEQGLAGLRRKWKRTSHE